MNNKHKKQREDGYQDGEATIADIDDIAAPDYDAAREKANPEQLLLRMALKELTPHQRKIWELYAYDQLTEDEVANKLGISQQTVSKQLNDITEKIMAFCNLNRGAYMLLKLDQKIQGG